MRFVDPSGRSDVAVGEALWDTLAVAARKTQIIVGTGAAIILTAAVLAITVDEIIDQIKEQWSKRFGSYELFAQCWLNVVLPMLKAALPGLVALAETDEQAFQVGLKQLYFAALAALKECMAAGGGGPN